MDIEQMKAAVNRGTLRLEDAGLEALPDDLTPLADVKVLDLSGNRLAALPDSLGALSGLRTLILTDNALTALPDVFDRLPALERLDVRRNKLADLPPSLAACAKLKTLRMAANKLSAVPDVLWHLGALKEVDGVKGYPNGHRKAAFDAFFEAVHRAELSPETRARLFAVWHGGAVADAPLVDLFAAMAIPHDGLRTAAHAAILARGGYAERPVAAGSKVVIVGNTHSKRTDLKARLQAVDAAYGTQIDADTTHVLVGERPKSWDGVDRPGLVFCGESDLIATLDALDTPYLVEEARESPEAAQDVAEMLESPDRDTVAMALELLSAGGVPEGVQTALFYVACGLGDKALGAKARKLLKVHGSAKVQKAVASRSKLFSTGDKAEKKTEAALLDYRHIAPELDWPRIALLIKRDHGVGLRFALDHGDEPTRMRALGLMVQDGTLDLFSHYAGYMPSYYNDYAYYDSETLPPEVYRFTELRGLVLQGCRLEALPPGISALAHLEVLDLRGNFLEALPDDLGDLARLRVLHLGNNRFDVFPSAVVSRLTSLEELTFVGNRGETPQERPAILRVPDEVRAALPGCRIEDGVHRWQESLERYHWEKA